MQRMATFVALVDCVLFLALAVCRGLSLLPSYLFSGYEVLAGLGLLLGIYGFVVLIRYKERYLRDATLCVLLALAPGCQALIALLNWLGGQPV
ncbi:MAG: hypothetical protein K6T63_00300 [Alicyclobacillus herbarius]|uniref:hypothetical protein n=1 Tax=Alicyclobacillus herbarius TaxID=122960 RepID=UPI000422C5CB|nr:hypothetical protein [Alicyclobacillus herbarius]MCL6631045.1 hypothetical protein [Alicyclobacillus herbarius]